MPDAIAAPAPNHPSGRSALQLRCGPYTFKRADSPHEVEQIHRLNYLTFVREIPQHTDPGCEMLVDKFHDKNLYIIALHGARVVGMVAVHDQPPFSTADRLSDRETLERLGQRLLEVRLLAVTGEARHSNVFLGLLWSLYRYASAAEYSHLIISGVQDKVAMYERMGFLALGPAKQAGGAWFVPMMLPLAAFPKSLEETARRWERHARIEGFSDRGARTSLLPGPVQIAPDVREAFAKPPVSHRSEEFHEQFDYARATLRKLVGGRSDVAILCGSGTLANDAIAATLKADARMRRGLILANGEFGERLVIQARRSELAFSVLSWPSGEPWQLDAVDRALAKVDWVWGVHSESSTGVLNDLPGFIKLTRRHDVRVCLDCVSSLGAVPVDLGNVFLASGASGKCLGSYAGLAFVFASQDDPPAVTNEHVPSYLDVREALATRGARFTVPSPLVFALAKALERYDSMQQQSLRFAAYAELGRVVRSGLSLLGVSPLAPAKWASPVLTTFEPPAGCAPDQFALLCRALNYDIYAVGKYLSERGFVQIATMGDVKPEQITPLFSALSRWFATAR